MVQSGTYIAHPAAFLDQPFAAPHQSFLSTGSEVPFDKKSSFPPGEAKNSETIGIYHSLKRSVSWVLGGKAARVAKLATPTDSKIFTNPIQQTALLRELREANSLPYNGCARPWAHTTQCSTPPQTARSGCQLPHRGSQGGYAAGGRLRASPTSSPSETSLFTIHSYLFPSPTQVGDTGRVRELMYPYRLRCGTKNRGRLP